MPSHDTSTASAIPSFLLTGRAAIVTGAGSGIGRAAAEALAAFGAEVGVLDRDRAAAEATVKAIITSGGTAAAFAADVTDEAQIEAAFRQVVQAFGPLAILVNSAGLAIRAPTVDLDLESWNKVVAVNLTGVFLCCRHAARSMTGGRGGSIINIASIMGLSGGGLYPNISYQSTKGAVVNMTRALAVEWAPLGIRVNAVAPTWVRTPFIAPLLAQPELVKKIEAMTPLGRLADPADVTGAIVFLAGPASAMVTGHTLPVDGGFLAQ